MDVKGKIIKLLIELLKDI